MKAKKCHYAIKYEWQRYKLSFFETYAHGRKQVYTYNILHRPKRDVLHLIAQNTKQYKSKVHSLL